MFREIRRWMYAREEEAYDSFVDIFHFSMEENKDNGLENWADLK